MLSRRMIRSNHKTHTHNNNNTRLAVSKVAYYEYDEVRLILQISLDTALGADFMAPKRLELPQYYFGPRGSCSMRPLQ